MKLEFKGTKGSWHLDSKTPKKGLYPSTELKINFDEHITNCVSVFCITDEGSQEDLANAKLIAAAPELLEACIEAEKHHQGGHSDIGWKLRKAIEKALK